MRPLLAVGFLSVLVLTSAACGQPVTASPPSPEAGLATPSVTIPPPPALTTSPKPPNPTRSPTPEPKHPLEYLEDAEVRAADPLDQLPQSEWVFTEDKVTLTDGVVRMEGSSDWGTILRHEGIEEGEGFIVLFQYSAVSVFDIVLMSGGEWDAADHRSFGIVKPNPTVHIDTFEGTKELNRGKVPKGNLFLKPDTWYNLIIAVDGDGDFLLVIWDPADPLVQKTYRESLGESWAGLTWMFSADALRGILSFDEYSEVSFTDIR